MAFTGSSQVTSLWPLMHAQSSAPLELPISFTGGRVDVRVTLHAEGGERLCTAAGRAELPGHVVEFGAGLFLSIDQVASLARAASTRPPCIARDHPRLPR